TSRPPSHGWGPGWLAMPSLYDSFIRDSKPVYPGAIQSCALRHPSSSFREGRFSFLIQLAADSTCQGIFSP
ncbi:MAG: hypothetical protein WB763_07130, partial [Terriglobia bacterium]